MGKIKLISLWKEGANVKPIAYPQLCALNWFINPMPYDKIQ
jgi:hypothetical protein